MPNASAPNAPWVAVWESPQTIVMPGLREAQLGPDHMDDALVGVAPAVKRDAELAAVVLQRPDLVRCHRVEDRQTAGVGRRRVVRGRDRPFGPPDLEAAFAEAGERLGAGDLVDEVEVDRENRGRIGLLGDDMVVPDLLDERARGIGRHQRSVA